MALMLSSSGILSRLGQPRALARDMIHREMASVTLCETAVSSLTFGILQGRFKNKGGLTLLLPVDLMAGLGLHAAAWFLPSLSGYRHHLRAWGNGALASFFTTTGYRVGERWAAGGTLRSGLSGIFGDAEKPVSGGSTLADQQLNNLVRAGV